MTQMAKAQLRLKSYNGTRLHVWYSPIWPHGAHGQVPVKQSYLRAARTKEADTKTQSRLSCTASCRTHTQTGADNMRRLTNKCEPNLHSGPPGSPNPLLRQPLAPVARALPHAPILFECRSYFVYCSHSHYKCTGHGRSRQYGNARKGTTCTQPYMPAECSVSTQHDSSTTSASATHSRHRTADTPAVPSWTHPALPTL